MQSNMQIHVLERSCFFQMFSPPLHTLYFQAQNLVESENSTLKHKIYTKAQNSCRSTKIMLTKFTWPSS